MSYRWRWARTAGLTGHAYAEAGRKARAIEVLRSGLIALDQLGARAEAQDVRAQLQTYGARAPRRAKETAVLTPRQLQVAILASRGLSDREIARETGISWRTVTTHMHAILGRLKLRSRFELADWLNRNQSVT